MMFSSVVFPDPLVPMIAANSPSSIPMSTSRKAYSSSVAERYRFDTLVSRIIVYLYLLSCLVGFIHGRRRAAAVIHRYDAWDCKASKSVCKSRKDVNRFISTGHSLASL